MRTSGPLVCSFAAALCAVFAACEDTTALPPATPPPAPPLVAAAPLPGVDEPVPALRLPQGVRPTAESIEMHVDPRSDRFSGVVDIDVTLATPRALLWLHGKDMHVTVATVTPTGQSPVAATWQQRNEDGVASLTLATAVPAGAARIHLAFDAPFEHGQAGLYKASEAGIPYAFTQFEAITARRAFPCFDEPSFKIPFTTTLVVPLDAQAVANTHEVSRTHERWPDSPGVSAIAAQRIVFAPTPPLPSYLVAFAVGPFDVVAAPDVPPNGVRTRKLPLRGVTVKGRGKDIAYTLSHTGEILSTLEQYIGLEYAYDKLDILAVPGKGGAMENPGAVTFGEQLLLMDPATAPISQRRAFAAVMAHELAHQWTGDLVTMQWWDDTWLNEAFATWIGNKATDAWDPRTHADLSFLRSIQGAMSADALVSARAVRQPIASVDDIQNSFDNLTYRKGGGVLQMFEKWAGTEKWQRGLHAYLAAHRDGNATADDFLDAESAATGKDVKTAFHTFLDQPGLPFVEVSVKCGGDKSSQAVAHLRQSRFLPAGSVGDAKKTWQLPVCLRADLGSTLATTCTLMTQPEADVALGGPGQCPAWVFPNADGAGYFRFSLAPADLANLRKKGLGKLTTREKMALGASLRGSYSRATTPYKDLLDAVAPLAKDAEPTVAEEPMSYLEDARDWLYDDALRPRVEAYASRLYAPAFASLGWTAAKDDDDQRRSLRGSVLSFLVTTGRDTALRAEAKKRARAYIGLGKDNAIHADAVDPNLAGTVLAVLGEDADKATWDAMKALFKKSVEEVVRSRLLWGMSLAKDPALSAAARELALDPDVRDSEVATPLWAQLDRTATREAAWTWLKSNFDAFRARLPRRSGGWLPSMGRRFCDTAHAEDVRSFFTARLGSLEGGPRTLAATVEDVGLCAARKKAQEASVREVFARKP